MKGIAILEAEIPLILTLALHFPMMDMQSKSRGTFCDDAPHSRWAFYAPRVELEGSQDLDVSQSLNARVSVMVHADGWLELMHVLAS